MITHDLVIKMLDFVKDPSCGTFEYGKWGTLNMEQRQLIRRLCESWLILDEATNKQTLEIERLKRLVQKKYYTMKDKLEVVNIFDDIQRCEIEEKDKEIERLHSIIKEVREYVDKWENIGRYKLLEILDKVDKEK